MQYAAIAILCGLSLSGCTGATDDDAKPAEIPDAGTESRDAPAMSPEQAGLSFEFVTEPGLLGGEPEVIDIDGNYEATISKASFTLQRVRIIGDSATGNGRTSVREFVLEWSDQAPALLQFPQAPPGIYSRMLGDIDSYHIEGTIGLGAGAKSFVIDESGVDAELSVGLMDLVLEPGMDAIFQVTISLRPLVSAIEWDQVDEDDNGALVVDERSRDIDCARASLELAFGKAEEGGERSCGDDDDSGGVDGGVDDVDAGGKDRDDGGVPTTGS